MSRLDDLKTELQETWQENEILQSENKELKDKVEATKKNVLRHIAKLTKLETNNVQDVNFLSASSVSHLIVDLDTRNARLNLTNKRISKEKTDTSDKLRELYCLFTKLKGIAVEFSIKEILEVINKYDEIILSDYRGKTTFRNI